MTPRADQARVLITGATGFIGSHLAKRLTSQAFRVHCLLRNPERRGSLPAEAEIIEGDLREPGKWEEALEDVETVYHLAGVTKAHSSAAYKAGNVLATERLLAALPKQARLVHVSSLAATNPVSVYGKSKREGEELVRRSSVTYVIMQPPVVYGPGDKDVLEFFRAVRKGWIATVGKGQRFSLIHVADLAEALLAAGTCDRALGKTYQPANREPITWNELGSMACSIMQCRAREVALPMPVAQFAAFGSEIASRLRRKPSIFSRDKVREARVPEWICDTDPIRRDLGFETRITLEEGVSQTLDWYKSAGWMKY